MPLVSVIIPVYNRPEYVVQAIESVLRQTFSDWELLVVDDGSTDETPAAIASYGKRLRHLRQSNQGVACARNTGVRSCSGEFTLFLDSDDELLPHALATLLQAHQHHPEVDLVSSDGVLFGATRQAGRLVSQFRVPRMFEIPLADIVLHNFLHPPCSVLVRTDRLKALPGPFDCELYGTEEWDMWIRLLATDALLFETGSVTCKYRIHDGNKSSPNAQHRDKWLDAMRLNREKTQAAAFFSGLPLDAQLSFFRDWLLNLERGHLEHQGNILQCIGFRNLPAPAQVSLLRQTAIDNMLNDRTRDITLERLETASALMPGDRITTLSLAAARAGRATLGAFVGLRKLQLALASRSGAKQPPIRFPFQEQ